MDFPVNLSLLKDTNHMPALPVLERSMNRDDLSLHDFCIPVNPYFPTDEMLSDLQGRLSYILRYYPSDNRTIAEVLAEFLGLSPESIVMANGSTELITWVNQRFITTSLVTDVPTFGRWTDNPRELGRTIHPIFRQASEDFQISIHDLVRFVEEKQANALAVCNPNNPTGALWEKEELLQLIDRLWHLDVIVIDESFLDFAAEDSICSIAEDASDFENVIVLKSLGKNLGLHGLRCGYAVTSGKLAKQLRAMLPPWNINSLAEEFIRLLGEAKQLYEASRKQVIRDSQAMATRLSELEGIRVYPTNANFVYCELDNAIAGTDLRDALLLKEGVFLRECGSKMGSSSQFLRIATRPAYQQDLLIEALRRTIPAVQHSRNCSTHSAFVSGKLAGSSLR